MQRSTKDRALEVIRNRHVSVTGSTKVGVLTFEGLRIQFYSACSVVVFVESSFESSYVEIMSFKRRYIHVECFTVSNSFTYALLAIPNVELRVHAQADGDGDPTSLSFTLK